MYKAILAAITPVALVAFLTAGNTAEHGAALYQSSGCANCHGPQGRNTSMPGLTELAGQDKSSLLEVMQGIKDGSRIQGRLAVMQPGLQKLSDAELEAIADWLSNLE